MMMTPAPAAVRYEPAAPAGALAGAAGSYSHPPRQGNIGWLFRLVWIILAALLTPPTQAETGGHKEFPSKTV
jgi:hypothetical protein